jgi:hypothetical protein
MLVVFAKFEPFSGAGIKILPVVRQKQGGLRAWSAAVGEPEAIDRN